MAFLSTTKENLPTLLSERIIFSPGGTCIESCLEGNIYKVKSYGESLVHVDCVTGALDFVVRPEHKFMAKHWDLCKQHIKIGPGFPVVQKDKRKDTGEARHADIRRKKKVLWYGAPVDTYRTAN